MFLKIHHSPGNPDVVAVCDAELLNTTIREGDLAITIHESFYGNQRANAAEVREALTKGDSVNLMGECAVSVAIEAGLATRKDCIMIGTIPHLQIYRL